VRLRVLEGDYAVCRLADGADAPGPTVPPAGTGFWSLTEVGEERSLVCLEDLVPEGAEERGATVVRGWRIIEVLGPLDLALTGVLAALSGPLARASVPIFPIATHDTDWILVPGAQLDAAVGALRRAGHETV
jgi:hypothetical protein